MTALRASPAEVDVPARQEVIDQVAATLLLEAFLQANAPPAGIDLGTAVLTSLAGGRSRAGMTEEGVVIEVVPPGRPVRSLRVIYSGSAASRSGSINAGSSRKVAVSL